MNPLLYWILFCLLVTLIVVLLSYIIFNFILDYCLHHPEDVGKACQSDNVESSERCHLSKYHFNKDDLEDLTRMEGDFKTILPKISCTNEVDTSKMDRLLQRKESIRVEPSLSDINEEDTLRYSTDDLQSAASVYSTVIEELADEPLKEKKGISRSVDDLEFCDPKGIDVLKQINRIKDEAVKVDRELDYFIGGPNDVKFYEINELFLKLMIALCDVVCETDELRRKKSETLEYIEGCQKKLKEKANYGV